jgi:hypothetical protein
MSENLVPQTNTLGQLFGAAPNLRRVDPDPAQQADAAAKRVRETQTPIAPRPDGGPITDPARLLPAPVEPEPEETEEL